MGYGWFFGKSFGLLFCFFWVVLVLRLYKFMEYIRMVSG